MIEDWILLVISAVAFLVGYFINKSIDKNEEKACDAWASKNIPDCAKEYSKYAKAENDDAKNEAKKKLINTIIGVAVGLLIMVVLSVWLKHSNAIAEWLSGFRKAE